MSQRPPVTSIESQQSWIVAGVTLGILAFSFGAPWIATVALKPIAAEADGSRAVPALAVALAWLGSGFGGIAMGYVAERIGVRWTVIFGAVMVACGLALSSFGPGWQLYLGHGLFIGLLGFGGINAPLYVYVSHWFDRRRGSALALISSGTYIAGAAWPPIFERAISAYGWRNSMLAYGLVEALVIVPLAAVFLVRAPETVEPAALGGDCATANRVMGWPPNLVFAMLLAAIFMCCVPMAMPQQHLVAFCSDLGINASRGAIMLSVLLGTAFLSRQIWGLIADRFGGLRTVFIGSAAQLVAMSAFLMVQDEYGLFSVSAAFGLGFSGLIPATLLAARELFPAREASWRIPMLLLSSATGMATGGWLAGYMYDHFGYYAPAFAIGIAVNALHVMVIGMLVRRRYFSAFAT